MVSKCHCFTLGCILFLLLTQNGKRAHYPELPDGQTELLDVTFDVELALKWEPVRLHLVLLDQPFQTLRETEALTHWTLKMTL